MEKKNIIEKYRTLGINNPNNLYDYILKHKNVTIDDRKFDLMQSNQVIEFMALYLLALDYQVTRLYFSKKKNSNERFRHWFLAFSDGEKWYYYEPVLKKVLGKFNFNDYNELIYFVSDKLNNNYAVDNYNYSLIEIGPLNNTSLEEDIEKSENGIEIFASDNLNFNIANNNSAIIEKEKVHNHSNDYIRSIKFFLIAFIITVIICLFVLFVTNIADKYL